MKALQIGKEDTRRRTTSDYLVEVTHPLLDTSVLFYAIFDKFQ
jgi:hypothetical protein